MKSKQARNTPETRIPVEDASDHATANEDLGTPETTGEAGAMEDPTPQELAALREQSAKAQEHWDRYVRLNADFDNYKKRAAKDRLDAIRYANEALIEKLLPVMDNFEAALAASASSDASSVESVITGVKMIATQLKGVLAESGLEEIEATGKAFDPTIHEALSQQPSEEVPEGHVLQQVRKGYRLRDRLVRPAAVVVAAKPAETDNGAA
jgi:molecular chaperone GrpE